MEVKEGELFAAPRQTFYLHCTFFQSGKYSLNYNRQQRVNCSPIWVKIGPINVARLKCTDLCNWLFWKRVFFLFPSLFFFLFWSVGRKTNSAEVDWIEKGIEYFKMLTGFYLFVESMLTELNDFPRKREENIWDCSDVRFRYLHRNFEWGKIPAEINTTLEIKCSGGFKLVIVACLHSRLTLERTMASR